MEIDEDGEEIGTKLHQLYFFFKCAIIISLRIMVTILPIIQITLSVILVAGILLQNRSAGIGALGGSDTVEAGFSTRRGPEKTLFLATIAVAVLFMIVSFISFIVR